MSNKFINLDNLKAYNKQMKETYIEPLEEKIEEKKIPTNYITTDTDQTDLSGNKTWSSTPVFKFKAADLVHPINGSIWAHYSTTIDTSENGYMDFAMHHSGGVTGIDVISSCKLDFNGLRVLDEPIQGSVDGCYTSYNGGSILHEYLTDGSAYDKQTAILTFPKESGVFATEKYVDEKVEETTEEAKKYADGNFSVNTFSLGATDVTSPGITKLEMKLGSMAVLHSNENCTATVTYKTRNYTTNSYDVKTAVSGEKGTLLMFLSENYEKGWGYTLTVVTLTSTSVLGANIPKTETAHFLIDIPPTATIDEIVTITVPTSGMYRRITTVGATPIVTYNAN